MGESGERLTDMSGGAAGFLRSYNDNAYGRPAVFLRSGFMTNSFRIEHDSMGELQVPADALWGAQTQRAVENFPVSGRPMPRDFIRALGLVKAAAAEVNAGFGLLPRNRATAIRRAALAVAAGDHDAHFPIDVYQTGSGTSSNMN